MTYAVTKFFHSGFLAGQEIKILTGVKFEQDKDYGDYICTFCKEINTEDVIAVVGSKYGIEKAWANGTLEFAKSCAKQFRVNGYDVRMYLMDG